MTEDEVVAEITRRAWRFNCAVLISDEPRVQAGDDVWCSGYFVANEPPLLVASRASGSLWLGILIHEYCHLTQWVEQSSHWQADESADWDAWLSGKRVPNIERKIIASRELEADCERRTVRMIRELDAPVDLDAYIRGANAYVHFYNVMLKKRKWFAKGRSPYHVPEVLAAANPTIDKDFSKTPQPLWDALLTCI